MDGSKTREPDVYAVILGLIKVMKEELADGRIIRLGSTAFDSHFDSTSTPLSIRSY